MKKSFFRFIIINIAICAVIIIGLAYYMIGVMDRSVVSNVVDKRFSSIEKAIDNSNKEIESILAQSSEDNIVKAKAVAIMLNQSPKAYLENESIEEIRVALSVEEIIITDENGIVIAGTSPFLNQDIHKNDIQKQFLPAIEDKGFSQVVNVENVSSASQYAGVSRLDKPGVIIIEATTSNLEQTIKLAGISTVTSGFYILKNGNVAIINKEKWEYVSHTDEKYIGNAVQIPKTEFKALKVDEKGKFKIKMQGVNSFVYYKEYKDNIIMAYLSMRDVYARRNYVVASLIIALCIFSLVSILAVRKKIIDNNIL